MKRILPLIVISQFLCCSVWFTGNVVVADIVGSMQLSPDFIGHIMSATQFGFIVGTLLFALFTISDLFSPSRVFFSSSILAAIFNLGIIVPENSGWGILLFRFFTGFFLAGIYPVGMKIASDHYKEGLGRSLGFLVGALAFGSGIPHLLKSLPFKLPAEYIVYTTSSLALLGGLCIFLFVPDGPHRKAGNRIKITALTDGFHNREFRTAALGYFGHMWELYAFWTFLPLIISTHNHLFPNDELNASLISFVVIAVGGISCMVSGVFSFRYGAKRIATLALFISGGCCLFSPLFLQIPSTLLFICFLMIWGFTVIADSPMFSSLIAASAPPESRGTSITFINSVGFFITIISIELMNSLLKELEPNYIYAFLAVGPIFGILNLISNTNYNLKS